MKVIKDMLTENGKWSQGRIYLIWSVLAYYVTLGILTFTGISKKHADIDINNFEIIIEALKYAMMLFAGYVFGNRFLEVIKTIRSSKSDSGGNEGEQQN